MLLDVTFDSTKNIMVKESWRGDIVCYGISFWLGNEAWTWIANLNNN